MYTAEIIRRQQIEAHWRLCQQRVHLMKVLKPMAELWGKKLREAYPELAAPHTNGERADG